MRSRAGDERARDALLQHEAMMRRAPCYCAVLFSLAFWPGTLLAQPAAAPSTPAATRVPPTSFEAGVEEAARELADVPRLRRLSPQKRRSIVEFVTGNMLFVASHEMGHAVIGQMQLPVLGREEDAADSFAILTALKIGTEFSERVLIEAAQGYFLSDRRDKKEGNKFAYYDEHGMNLQRAYQVVCFLVGFDSKRFQDLANDTKLPEDRQESCKADYNNTAWSWNELLERHFRTADQPKQKIEVIYGDAKGPLEIYARTFRRTRFLETVAEHIASRFAWPHPLVLEMKSCGTANARWRASVRRLELCYELAQEFALLNRDYGKAPTPFTQRIKREAHAIAPGGTSK
jgi:hypothetical protein